MGYVGPAVVRRLREAYPGRPSSVSTPGTSLTASRAARAAPERVLDCPVLRRRAQLPAAVLEDVDAVVHLAAQSRTTRSETLRRRDARREPRGDGPSRPRGEGGRSAVVRARVELQHLRRQRGRGRDRGVTRPAPTPYARSKWLAEQDLEPLADDGFAVTSLPLRDRVWDERSPASRSRPQRLRRLGDRLADDHDPERRNARGAPSSTSPTWPARSSGRSRATPPGGPFLAVNTGSDEWNYRIRDLAEEVARVIPGVDVSLAATSGPDKRSYRVSFERYKALAPEHQPEVDSAGRGRGAEGGPGTMGFERPRVSVVWPGAARRAPGPARARASDRSARVDLTCRCLRSWTLIAASGGTLRPEVPLLRRAARAHVRRPGLLAARELRTDREQLARARAFYPLHVYVCDRCFLVQLPPVDDSGGDLRRLPVLLVVLGQLGRARQAATSRHDRHTSASTRAAASSRSRATTATCCGTSASAAYRCSESSRPRTSPQRPSARASRRWSSSSGSRRRSACAREGDAADLVVGNNVLAHVPDLDDFVAGVRMLLKPGGVVDDGVPAPAAADRERRVRHDLPRALLVLLAARGRAALRRRTA